MPKSLPASPHLEQLKKQAKELVKALQSNDSTALNRVRQYHPARSIASEFSCSERAFRLSDSQLVLAREYGFPSWPRLKSRVELLSNLQLPFHQQFLDEAMIRTANKQKNLPRVQQLLDEGANINGRLAQVGTTALGWAACGGHIGLMTFLLERGADINMPANADNPALSLAAFFGHHRAVELLLSHGAEVNTPTPGNYTALHNSTYSGDDEAVRLLVNAGAQINVQTTIGHFGQYWFYLPYCGETPLHNAMAYGSQSMIQMLLDAGADARITTRYGETPFHWAGRFEKQRSKQFMRWLRGVEASC